jgi:hypothetical protein
MLQRMCWSSYDISGHQGFHELHTIFSVDTADRNMEMRRCGIHPISKNTGKKQDRKGSLFPAWAKPISWSIEQDLSIENVQNLAHVGNIEDRGILKHEKGGT